MRGVIAPERAGRSRKRRRVTILIVVFAAAAACGPIGYIGQVTRTASTTVEEARIANAARYSPYWWTRAVEYLHQARVEAARSDFQAANRFGRLANEAATKARDESLAAARDPSKAPAKVPVRDDDKLSPVKDGTDVAPAKDEP
jgi:hypothetical protein